MKLPGFTAEGAIGKPTKTYRTFRSFGHDTHQRVGPAAVFPAQLEAYDEEMGEDFMEGEEGLDDEEDMDDEDDDMEADEDNGEDFGSEAED